MLRHKLYAAQPNQGHKLIKDLEKDFDVTVITQNVDNLHRKGGIQERDPPAWRTLQGLLFARSLRLSIHQGVAGE